MSDLDSLHWISATAKMSITDVMWQYSIQVHGDGSDVEPFQMLEYMHPETGEPLIRCIPVSKEIMHDGPKTTTNIGGYSLAWYLNTPIFIMERQSKITLNSSGEITAYENPITYLNRIWNKTDFGLVPVFQPVTSEDSLKKQYTYDAHPIIDLISEIAEDYGRIYYECIELVNGNPVHKFYLVNFADIDTQLNLPEMVTINATSVDLVGSPGPSISQNVSNRKNVVWVELCRKKDNAWFFAERKTQAVIDGDELPRIMVYRSNNLLPDPAGDRYPAGTPASLNYGCVTVIPGYADQSGGVSYGTTAENNACQKITNDKAEELIDFLELDVNEYQITMRLTQSYMYSFKLYQKLQFAGFDSLPSGVEMRITSIEYNLEGYSRGRDTVTLNIVPDEELQAARQFELMQDEVRSNYTMLRQSIERGIVNNKVGVVKSVSSGRVYANLQLRSSGRIVQTRAWGERVK